MRSCQQPRDCDLAHRGCSGPARAQRSLILALERSIRTFVRHWWRVPQLWNRLLHVRSVGKKTEVVEYGHVSELVQEPRKSACVSTSSSQQYYDNIIITSDRTTNRAVGRYQHTTTSDFKVCSTLPFPIFSGDVLWIATSR